MNTDLSSENRNLSNGVRSYTPQKDQVDGAADARRLEDRSLIGQIAEGKREALEALYDRYSNAVYSLALQMLRDVGAAEEVTQDAFFNAWRRAASYSPQRGHVTSWLFSIAHHRAIDELRRRRRHDQAQSHRDLDIANQPADDSTDPIKFAALQFQRGQVNEALEVLGPEQREVVVLAYYGGFTHSEIANRLGKPLGTVKTRMRLALKKLRDAMTLHDEEWA